MKTDQGIALDAARAVRPAHGRTFMADTWWVAWREIKRFLRQRARIIMILVQPFIWLALMGNMFERLASVPGFPADSYLDYMAPGVITMVTLFGGIFGGMSIVWDRRLGYLNKLLAAPITRASVVSGKMLAIGLQTGVQASIIFVIALLMGVSFKTGFLGALAVIFLAVLLSLVFAGISLSFGAMITSHETLMAVVNFFTMPLMFTSNAMMPLAFMPSWLRAVAQLNPLSYAINPMRSLFLTGWNVSELVIGAIVLLGLSVALGWLATRLLRRAMA